MDKEKADMLPSLKILAVDDSPTMRRIIVNTLRRAGVEHISEASDGKDALEKLKVEKFDLLITDWNMPEMDGISLVTSVRATPELRELPILMVTTRSVKEDIVEAMKAGVNSYIVKPFTSDTLSAKIQQVMVSTGRV